MREDLEKEMPDLWAGYGFNPCFYLDERGSRLNVFDQVRQHSFNPCFYLDERGSARDVDATEAVFWFQSLFLFG